MSQATGQPYYSVVVEDPGRNPDLVARTIALNTSLGYPAASAKLKSLPTELALRLDTKEAERLYDALVQAGARASIKLAVRTSTLERRNAVRLSPSGSLDAHHFDVLERDLDALLDEGRSAIEVDLAGVTYISSAGVGVILNARKRAEAVGGFLRIANPSPPVREVFEMLGLKDLLE